jgi:hypothetical protein
VGGAALERLKIIMGANSLLTQIVGAKQKIQTNKVPNFTKNKTD